MTYEQCKVGVKVLHKTLGKAVIEDTNSLFHPHAAELGYTYIRLDNPTDDTSPVMLVDIEALTLLDDK